MKGKLFRVKNNIISLIRRGEAFLISHRYVSGITVIELVLILVKNLALYIEYIEGEKTLKINYIHAIHKNKDKLNFLRKR